ncbi:Uncharacterised protein [Legionella cincinnatiensis]|uniref:Uncharacterized protein n=1 Tax=Legionella cincinnatiensis TaxID=28085 RepID=A0A378IGN8_9GAMM|nr:hypothetical protein Lcin_0815 [Legionella cincinnatiensis]STX33661.1 Uncharacterised protein [Legionella cincinnatiensis]
MEYTRHPRPDNFVINLLSGLAAYMLKLKKASLKIHSLNENLGMLMSNSGQPNFLFKSDSVLLPVQNIATFSSYSMVCMHKLTCSDDFSAASSIGFA